MKILILFLLFISACTPINKQAGLQDDNPIEEIIEAVIQLKTHLDLDLSPDSPESKAALHSQDTYSF